MNREKISVSDWRTFTSIVEAQSRQSRDILQKVKGGKPVQETERQYIGEKGIVDIVKEGAEGAYGNPHTPLYSSTSKESELPRLITLAAEYFFYESEQADTPEKRRHMLTAIETTLQNVAQGKHPSSRDLERAILFHAYIHTYISRSM